MDKISVIIIEDDFDFRNTIMDQINLTSKFYVPKTYLTFEQFFTDLDNQSIEIPDILIVDIQLPGMNGLLGIQKITSISNDIIIIVLTVFNDEQKLFKAFQVGASSYVLKSDSILNIPTVLEITYSGGAYMSPIIAKKIQHFFNPSKNIKNRDLLTDREGEIINLLSIGVKYKDIAEKLYISLDTVRYHIKNIYFKLKINSRDEIRNYF